MKEIYESFKAIEWEDEQLEEMGIDRKKLEKVLDLLADANKRIQKMNMGVYLDGNGNVCFYHKDKPIWNGNGVSNQDNIVAIVTVNRWSGGDW